MSAFVVQDTVINALVTFSACCEGCRLSRHMLIDFHHDRQIVGQILLDENYRSVNSRYNENDAAPNYRHKKYQRPLKPVHILKLCGYLTYQSCETDDWQDSNAYRLIQWIKNEAISQLSGYDDFQPWHI